MKINVTLTATSNTYLAPELPLVGELEIFETGTNGSIVTAAFRCEHLDGTLSAPVRVTDIEFTYGSTPAYPTGRTRLPAWAATPGTGLWTEEERRDNRWKQQLRTNRDSDTVYDHADR